MRDEDTPRQGGAGENHLEMIPECGSAVDTAFQYGETGAKGVITDWIFKDHSWLQLVEGGSALVRCVAADRKKIKGV